MRYRCWRGHEACAHIPDGSCLVLPCTCETTGHCAACPGVT